jgi:3-oxoacyl-(acyl-carrier-protein) synthase
MSKRIFITGIGIITSIGNNVKETLISLLGEKSGIGEITQFQTMHQGKLPVAEVKLTTGQLLEMTGNAGKRNLTRTALLGMVAATEALQSAGISNVRSIRTGLVSATTVGGMDRSENFYRDFMEDGKKGRLIDIVNHDCGDSTERIARHIGITDFITTISTACSSSANAIMTGVNMIRSGQIDRAVVGGTDAVTRFTLNGFNTLMILDKSGCRPFDDNRAGLTLGEGAAFLVLEGEDTVKASNRAAYGEIKGFGNANDAFHQTASSPEGTGAYMAMSAAIAMSGLTPGEIDYINVHGTGTQNNDLSEGVAMQRIFGDNLPPFSSTKSYTGHTLGAAGAVESVISVLAIRNSVLFPNLRFETPMKELPISPVKNLIPGMTIKNVLSNSFGFGGNNSSVIISKVEDLS